VYIENKSGFEVKECSVYIQGKVFAVNSMKPQERDTLRIKKASVPVAVKDFRMEVAFKNSHGSEMLGSYYTDLGGMPNKIYRVTLYSDKAVIGLK
jgi:hypothetical protein